MQEHGMAAMFGEFPIVVAQNVIWSDMDAFGHVNNAVYLRYFEDGRMAYFDRIGVDEYKQQANLGPIMARVSCDFRAPLHYPDAIQIGTRSVLLSAGKLSMQFAVYSEKLGRIVADGEGLVLYYDYSLGRSCDIPQPIVAAMENLEGQIWLTC
jgi:acyl-CoA thioester hydrolase